MFSITEKNINITEAKKLLKSESAGGFNSFEGWVRNQNDGEAVHGLTYEIYDDLALSEGHEIIQEAKQRFKITDALAIHRKGELKIGDLAVWVGVAAVHRDAAFKACRYIIDEIKDRLPVWKKEHYVSGQMEWVNCKGCSESFSRSKISKTELFEKPSKLPTIGPSGQEQLSRSKVLVIGAGGLGCPALIYLASSGVGHITIIDGDLVEVSNLHRQPLFGWQDIGSYKSRIARQRLLELMPHVDVQWKEESFDSMHALDTVIDFDIVVDCTDNFLAKFLIHDACQLTGTPLIQASIYQFEGQLNVFKGGQQDSCLRCLYPKQLEDGCVGNCTEVGVLGPVAGVLGTLQAIEAIKLLVDPNGYNLNQTLLVDMKNAISVQKINREKNPHCPLCSDKPTIHSYNFADIHGKDEDYEVDVQDIQAWNGYHFVDIRDRTELKDSDPKAKNLKYMPKGEGINEIAGPLVIVCQRGMRSLHLAKQLREQGREAVYSLRGGIASLKWLDIPCSHRHE